MSYSKLSAISFGTNNWCLKLQPIYDRGLLVSLSSGDVQVIDWTKNVAAHTIHAHESPVNDMAIINSDSKSGSIVATAAEDGVKIYDLRSSALVASLKNDKSAPALSLDSRHNLLAYGTELSGVDAELHLYDIRSWSKPLRSLVDSHHDDVTSIKFHPSDPNVLLSGSTDGYANVYDLVQQEEDDALHQVINFASIHSCGWSAYNKIYTLSHMETFGIHALNDKFEELSEPKPIDFGDIRGHWKCNYVIDVYPGFVATGKSEEGDGELRIIPFQNDSVDPASAVRIPNAHGDEVIRDVLVPTVNQELLYSCAEDGNVNIWKSDNGAINVPSEFWNYSEPMDLFKDEVPLLDMSDVTAATADSTPEPAMTHSEASKNTSKKDKKKSKKSKGSKSSKSSTKPSSRDQRFHPY
ncbi:LADA_0E10924g1_1 [Lachancea dasiensis]|uniref:LADA_0E10924g1_1 n=1 Tax=Lachancea dasiensis TaxID=1072105 RepID=A0A1G4JE89_9SACH|nr:LADA_0E10924g1_1 [Lachancea dasiensis]